MAPDPSRAERIAKKDRLAVSIVLSAPSLLQEREDRARPAPTCIYCISSGRSRAGVPYCTALVSPYVLRRPSCGRTPRSKL